MAEAMKTVAIKVGELTAKEKVLLSVGYKKVLGPSRSSWRKLSRMLNKESDITKTTGIIEYRNKLEKEITDICTDVVSIIDGILIPSSKDRDANAAAYYYKIAIKIARVAFDEACSWLEFDSSNEEACKTRLHLRDNLITWREAGNNDGDNIPPSA
ncbi:hypothetical protein ACS0TY_017329 [Phlomoides rotata]